MSRRRNINIGSEVELLWNFHPEHVRDGPADGVPITITASPRRTIHVTTDREYFTHLVQGFKATMQALVLNYAQRRGLRIRGTRWILDLPLFFFPTDMDSGEQIRVSRGNVTLRGLTVERFTEIFELIQSGTIN